MRSYGEWIALYGESHQNHLNQKIHYVCVPLILWATLGLLHSIPLWPNLSFLVGGIMLAFYWRLAFRYALAMGLVFVTIFASFFLFDSKGLFWSSAIIFALAWIAQFVGHSIEGKRPSFIHDVQFLMIGPLWVFDKFQGQLFK